MASSKKAIFAAIAGNLAIAVTKFVAAAIGGSSAMLAEGIHSLVDTGNGVLLLVGIRQASRPANAQHPFGHGMYLYFYTLIVAILIFALGGGFSIYEGIVHVSHERALGDPTVSYIVLGLSIVFEGGSWFVAYREFRKLQGTRSLVQAIRQSKDPSSFAVLFEDTAAIAGLVVALVGIFLAHQLGMPALDGGASIVIGLILCSVALGLILETRSLMIGESADPIVQDSIRQVVEDDPAVEGIVRAMTLQLGAHSVLLALDIAFHRPIGSLADLERAIDRIERAVRTRHPEVKHIFIEAESLKGRQPHPA